ncbi:hypothetical protein CWB96_22460 [Pseudoalteromonas citrea]|uniref:Uncharacterized protein n=1 Tax=Pseudoalteromonas citrea TaxID=43655 RepID=A0A5S3XDR7_9GAMM|nr:hypothetical protein [Pseudoalteromonas citrea]TMP37834.1 hypothetical protein CWB97_22535 [Pseudoalteromonas citrea]TMP51213.1 hypothetical protein CWB96_22460 [Pseudoalteromonas citrea]
MKIHSYAFYLALLLLAKPVLAVNPGFYDCLMNYGDSKRDSFNFHNTEINDLRLGIREKAEEISCGFNVIYRRNVGREISIEKPYIAFTIMDPNLKPDSASEMEDILSCDLAYTKQISGWVSGKVSTTVENKWGSIYVYSISNEQIKSLINGASDFSASFECKVQDKIRAMELGEIGITVRKRVAIGDV